MNKSSRSSEVQRMPEQEGAALIRVVGVGGGVVGGHPLEPGRGHVVALAGPQRRDEVLERAVGGGHRHPTPIGLVGQLEHAGGEIGLGDRIRASTLLYSVW